MYLFSILKWNVYKQFGMVVLVLRYVIRGYC